MRRIVIDASMAAAWTLDDEKTDSGDRILDEVKSNHALTTSLFWHEYRNILVINHRRGRVAKEKVSILMDDIRALEIQEYPQADDDAIVSMAFHHNLSAYDAAYLTLAAQQNALLATNDLKLARAALAEGLELLTTLDRSQITQ